MKRLFLLLIIAFGSCQSVLKTAYGIKDPKIESKKEIQSFVLKHNLDTTRIVFFKNLMGFTLASKNKYLNIPDAIFFNSKGDFVDYKKTASDCNAGVGAFLTDLREFENRVPNPDKKLSDFNQLLASDSSSAKQGIIVYITFAKYVGKLNRDKAFEWVKLIEKAQKDGLDIDYYLLNCDFLDSWNIPPKLHETLGIKS